MIQKMIVRDVIVETFVFTETSLHVSQCVISTVYVCDDVIGHLTP